MGHDDFRLDVDDDSFEIDGVCTHETDLAILVSTQDLGDIWVPKSCLDVETQVENDGDDGKLVVKHSFAESKGWV